jgi:hypothetical protein
MSEEEETMSELLDEIPNKGDVTYRDDYRIENAGSFPITFVGEEMSVIELGSDGKRVNRPDVAARGLGFISEALERAGGVMDNSHLRLVYDEEET